MENASWAKEFSQKTFFLLTQNHLNMLSEITSPLVGYEDVQAHLTRSLQEVRRVQWQMRGNETWTSSCKDNMFITKHNIHCTPLGGLHEMPSCHYALCCSVVKYDILIGKCYDDCSIKQHAVSHSFFSYFAWPQLQFTFYHWIFNIKRFVSHLCRVCALWSSQSLFPPHEPSVDRGSAALHRTQPCWGTPGAAPSPTGSLDPRPCSQSSESTCGFSIRLYFLERFL